MSVQQPDSTTWPEGAIDPNVVLILAPGLRHEAEGCGERVDCPLGCEVGGPYHAAERLVRRAGTFLYCNRCHVGWRELWAAA